MKWTAKIATGNDAIDAEHRALLDCLGDLKRAMLENRTLFTVYTLTRLKHHVSDHFTSEETLLRAQKSPDLQQHLQDHQQFRYKLIEIQVKSIHGDVSMETIDFLSTWLDDHVAVFAKNYRATSSH
jgi:hemerythrin-like metal-binding protein